MPSFRSFFAPLILTLPLPICGQSIPSPDQNAPPASTFSIIGRDPQTGEIGIAVQSKIVAVGAIVPFADGEVGAVATQAYANVAYGPIGLWMLRNRRSPQEILQDFRQQDPGFDHRQVAILARDGATAAHTGTACIPTAGHRIGHNYIVQGNLLASDEVVAAMAEAFETETGLLADRLMAALRAGQEAGGDRRGRQSAALLIVREGWGYGGMNDRFRDLRVDEHSDPIEELARVLEAHRTLFPRPAGN